MGTEERCSYVYEDGHDGTYTYGKAEYLPVQCVERADFAVVDAGTFLRYACARHLGDVVARVGVSTVTALEVE